MKKKIKITCSLVNPKLTSSLMSFSVNLSLGNTDCAELAELLFLELLLLEAAFQFGAFATIN